MTTQTVQATRDDRAVVDKAFSLLEAFGAQGGGGLGVSELARRAGMSKSTAFRVLAMLERNAMVERTGTDYRLGSRLRELGRSEATRNQDQIRDALLPYLTELYGLTQQTVHLAMLDGTDVVYLAKLYGRRTVAAPSRIGGRLPAHCTAVGKLLLAYEPDNANQALSAGLRTMTPLSTCTRDQLVTDMRAVLRDGIAFDFEGSQLGVHCVAAPVFTRGGRPLAALSVSAPRGGDMSTLSQSLRRVCAAASQDVSRLQLAPVP
ncbi:IclR family transcriptional regulator [Mycolicibacterium sp. (ex Dasyatis americana)]|nr:IclR family transcriptional regulator [Mycolicibacterium sp. (ex Dasyatis americana)]